MILAYLSLKYVEAPIRRGLLTRNYFFSTFLLLSVGLLAFSYYGHISVGYESYKLAKIEEQKRGLYVSHANEMGRREQFRREFLSKLTLDSADEGTVVAVGDSLAEDVAMALLMRGVSVRRIDLDGLCWADLLSKGFACGKSKYDLLYQLKKAKMVILASDFSLEMSAPSTVGLQQLLSQNDIPSKVLGTLRFRHISNTAFQYMRGSFQSGSLEKLFYRTLDPRMYPANRILLESAHDEGFIDKAKSFCDEGNKSCRFYSPGGKPYFYDEIHLTMEGLEYFGGEIDSLFKAK